MARWSFPTNFDGITYRSKTEAKWAKFWKGLGIKCDYEDQGFLTDGSAYLPDFAVYAACGTIWAEVKPDWLSDEAGIAKFRKFAGQRPQPSRAVLLIGPPRADRAYLVIGGDDTQDDPLKGAWEDDAQQWRPCPSGYHFDLAYPGQFRARFAMDGCTDWHIGPGEDRLRRVADAARSARFDGTDPDDTAA
jgi:hypothetical protein